MDYQPMGADEIVAFIFVVGIALLSLVLPILALLIAAGHGQWPW